MRLRLTLDRIVLLDMSLFETEPEPDEPTQVVDMSTGHDIGFTRPAGWREPKDDEARG